MRRLDLDRFTVSEGAKGAKMLTINPLRRRIGAEIEVASIDDYTQDLADTLARWSVSTVDDGSLPSSGVECVTSPLAGDHWVRGIADITRAIRRAGGAVSPACGLHIHVDASDLRSYELRRLIRLYAHAETALFGMCAASRLKSSYCAPCGSTLLGWIAGTDRATKAIKRSAYGVRQGRGYSPEVTNKYHSSRYNALNLHSYFHRGTVEFRHHHGTIDATKITNWGLICASIVEAASTRTDAQIDLLTALAPIVCLETLAPTAGVRAWIRPRMERLRSIAGNRELGEE